MYFYSALIILNQRENPGRSLNLIVYFCAMPNQENDYSFWTKYKRFASTEILMYLIMIIGIALGIIFLS